MEAKKATQKKNRRTNAELEQDMASAIEAIVSKKGFTPIPFMEFIKEANIDSSVFYRRYDSVGEMYKDLARRYDFWLSSVIDITKLPELGDKEFFIYVLEALHRDVVDNKIMQKLLLWELTDANEVTKHTSQFRDTVNSNLIMYYKRIFDPLNIDIASIIALFISGIYYLTLHRGIATFCLIDFSSKDGYEKLDRAVRFVAELLFAQVENRRKQIEMAKEMTKDGISRNKICKYMGIQQEELETLLRKPGDRKLNCVR